MEIYAVQYNSRRWSLLTSVIRNINLMLCVAQYTVRYLLQCIPHAMYSCCDVFAHWKSNRLSCDFSIDFNANSCSFSLDRYMKSQPLVLLPQIYSCSNNHRSFNPRNDFFSWLELKPVVSKLS